jgi:phosphopantetheinyl transferase (holo-ACP synthase)
MGTGFRRGKWTDVEIVHDEWGAPIYNITGEYVTWAPKDLRLCRLCLSVMTAVMPSLWPWPAGRCSLIFVYVS